MTTDEAKWLLVIKDVVVRDFTRENWLELATLTGRLDAVKNHGRLLRSLDWGDPDYGGHAFSVLTDMASADANNLRVIEQYVSQRYDLGGVNVSSIEAPGRRVYITPQVFQFPPTDTEPDLLSVMMPFDASFGAVHVAIAQAAHNGGMRCQRGDDIWISSTVVQDVFSLIYRSFIVVCDFTGKNANVFYEAGIAHALGKHVIPITQYPDDIPFDLRAHRYLQYHGNAQGHAKLTDDLTKRIQTLRSASAIAGPSLFKPI